MDEVAVAVLATDPVTEEGTVALISSYSNRVTVSKDSDDPVDVLLVLANQVTDDVLAGMETMGRQSGRPDPPRIVLVADHIGERRLRRAIDIGLVDLLPRREIEVTELIDAVVAAATHPPPTREIVLTTLVDLAQSQEDSTSALKGRSHVGFATREADVLRLLSDGLSMPEIARNLNYSERTVRYIIRRVTTRHGLRNRTHAVAYALRHGAL